MTASPASVLFTSPTLDCLFPRCLAHVQFLAFVFVWNTALLFLPFPAPVPGLPYNLFPCTLAIALHMLLLFFLMVAITFFLKRLDISLSAISTLVYDIGAMSKVLSNERWNCSGGESQYKVNL